MLSFLFARRERLIDRLDLTGADEAFRRKQAAKYKAKSDATPEKTTAQPARKAEA
jgi:hypothetical protein